MPPSGYSSGQASHLRAFLQSCASDLLREAVAEGQEIRAKLVSEIGDIDGYLADGHAPHAATRSVLELTRSFYSDVLTRHPELAADYWQAVEAALQAIGAQILEVHISGDLKERYATLRSAAE